MERDQRVRIVGGVGAAVSFARRRQTRNPRRKAAHNGAIVGGRQSGAETPAREIIIKTEFAISPEEREVTTMNVCTAGGSQGNAAPPLKMAEKIAFAFAAHSLPPSDIKETCLLIVEKDGGRRNSN